MREVNGRKLTLPGTFVSNNSKRGIRAKFREMEIHKQRSSLKEVARQLNPLILGLINYFHKLASRQERCIEWLKPSLIKVGQMGEGFVEVPVSSLAQTTIQTKPGIIYPLEIGLALTNLAATRT